MNVEEARKLQKQFEENKGNIDSFIKNKYPKILESVIDSVEGEIKENASLGKSWCFYNIKGGGLYNLAISLTCRAHAKTEEQQQYVKEHIEQDLVNHFAKEGFEASIKAYDEMRSIIDLYIKWGE